jgi:AcrR family transcriptional regulator
VRQHDEGPRRRVPQQPRSIGRVERILQVTSELVVTHGVEGVTTRVVAAAAGIPVPSLYQYFQGKDAILLALLERDVAELEEEIATALGRLAEQTVHGIVESTIQAFVRVFRRRPAFVVIWLRGRTNPAVAEFCQVHKKRIAHSVFDVARSAGLTTEGAVGRYAELAVEVSDRLFQIAFEESLEGDDHVIGEAVAVVSSYLTAHAAPDAAGPG